jgi:hypothetical protein
VANRKGENRLSVGWGARIRTWEWRNQNPLPYHLATPQWDGGDLTGKAESPQPSGAPRTRHHG